MIFLAFNTLCLAVVTSGLPEPQPGGRDWAVLVAGATDTEGGYIVEADVCHAYHTLRKHGVPDSNIVLMMYDDAAYSPQNPFPGMIRNQEGGPNVYKHIVKDYTGNEVTPENFLNVLLGNKEAMAGIGSGKVLESGPQDNVFVMYAGHGNSHVSAFPNNRYLMPHHLLRTLQRMRHRGMFNNCSQQLQQIQRNRAQISRNFKNHFFASSQFNIAWLGDIERNEMMGTYGSETVGQQFLNVKEEVLDSQPQMYGNLSLTKDLVRNYFGYSVLPYRLEDSPSLLYQDTNLLKPVSLRSLPLEQLESQISNAEKVEERLDLERQKSDLLQKEFAVSEFFDEVVKSVVGASYGKTQHLFTSVHDSLPLRPEDLPCYETLVDSFSTTCPEVNQGLFGMNHLWKLATLCSLNYPVLIMLVFLC